MNNKYHKIYILTVIILLLTCMNLYSQKPTFTGRSLNINPEFRNNWGIHFLYSESGFGFSSSYFFKGGKNTDLFLGVSVSGVTDNREITEYDIYGNSIVRGKINRVYMIPLNIGIQRYMFREDIEGNFTPLISAGISPTLILTNPYDREFFNALGYFRTGFALGGFLGIGMEYRQSPKLAVNLNVRYFYLPVIGREIMSLQNKPMNDIGGLQFSVGLNFQKK